MPQMTQEEFAKINWAEIPDEEWENYNSGLEVKGKTLSMKQRIQARAARQGTTAGGHKVKATEVGLEFRPGDVQGDDLGAAPFANQGIDVAEFGVRWWFQYFWQEAKMVANEQQRGTMADICNELFTKTPQGPHKFVVKDAYANDNADTGKAAKWLEWMEKMLEIGFFKVDTKEVVQTGPQPLPVLRPAPHHMMLQTYFSDYVAKKGEVGAEDFKAETQIFWRGESRDMQKIRTQKGTKRQSVVDSLRTDMKMDKTWHPFKEDKNNQYLWYRRGQNDNDYYTVISVGMNFETALCFPKINEKRVYGFPARPLDKWTKAEAQKHRANLALVVMDDYEDRVMVATSITVYMCVICGRIIDTQGAGGGFPEKGVEEIPLDQIFALLPVTRVHLGMEPEDGFTAFVDYNQGQLVAEDFGKAMDLFHGVYERLCEEYFKHKYGPEVTTAWTGGGPAAPRVKGSVFRIKEFPIGEAAFNSFKGTLSG
jgi:hypothetical protein